MKEMKKEVVFAVLLVFLIVLISSFASAGFFDWFKKVTGYDVKTLVMNISIAGGTAPQIILVYNETMTEVSSSGLTAGPGITNISINFSVYDNDGAGNINDGSILINFSKATEEIRTNMTQCGKVASSGKYSNYTCNVSMWWFDAAGTWNINLYITDIDNNATINNTNTFQVGQTTGFNLGPAGLTWVPIIPGSRNSTSNNDPLTLNNTGNKDIAVGSLKINATNLRGETDSGKALWSGNFSVNWSNGGSPPVECSGAIMSSVAAYVAVGTANLTRGNYTKNDGKTGQEQLYFCLKHAGSELTTQPYSTFLEGPWTVQVT